MMRSSLRYLSQASILGVSLTVGLAVNANALTLTPSNNGADLANSILGQGINVTPGTINYTGADGASGFFGDGMSSGIGIESGIILTTGQASDAIGPNNEGGKTTTNNAAGDSDLSSLISNTSTSNASVLEFEFESEGGDLFFDFVFASEEYNEYVNAGFNDVFGFFLDGENIALIPGTDTAVSINNVNLEDNPSFYNNNDAAAGSPFDIQYDGFTDVFQAQALGLSAGTHSIKLAVADAGDSAFDSAVFIAANSFADVEDPTPDPVDPPVSDDPSTVTTPESGSMVGLIALGLIGSASAFNKKRFINR